MDRRRCFSSSDVKKKKKDGVEEAEEGNDVESLDGACKSRRFEALQRDEYDGFSEDVDTDDDATTRRRRSEMKKFDVDDGNGAGATNAGRNAENLGSTRCGYSGRALSGIGGKDARPKERQSADKDHRQIRGQAERPSGRQPDRPSDQRPGLNHNSNRNPFKRAHRENERSRFNGGNGGARENSHLDSTHSAAASSAPLAVEGSVPTTSRRGATSSETNRRNCGPNSVPVCMASVRERENQAVSKQRLQRQRTPELDESPCSKEHPPENDPWEGAAVEEDALTRQAEAPLPYYQASVGTATPPSYSYHHPPPRHYPPYPYPPHPRYGAGFFDDDYRYAPSTGAGVAPGSAAPAPLFGYPRPHEGESASLDLSASFEATPPVVRNFNVNAGAQNATVGRGVIDKNAGKQQQLVRKPDAKQIVRQNAQPLQRQNQQRAASTAYTSYSYLKRGSLDGEEQRQATRLQRQDQQQQERRQRATDDDEDTADKDDNKKSPIVDATSPSHQTESPPPPPPSSSSSPLPAALSLFIDAVRSPSHLSQVGFWTFAIGVSLGFLLPAIFGAGNRGKSDAAYELVNAAEGRCGGDVGGGCGECGGGAGCGCSGPDLKGFRTVRPRRY